MRIKLQMTRAYDSQRGSGFHGACILSLISLGLTGCMRARPHLYPVCFYQTAPSLDVVQNVYAPHLIAILNAARKGPATLHAALSPDGRWLVASLTKGQNAAISRVWPRVGCVGDPHNNETTKEEMDCVKFEQQFVSGSNYFLFGNNRNPVFGIDIWNESPLPQTEVYCHAVR
jgi:hypothetical protein